MMDVKNDPYLTCTPPYKLGKTVSSVTCSVRFYNGLGWGTGFPECWGKGKESRYLRSATKGDHPVCGSLKPRCPRMRPLSPTVRGMRMFERSLDSTVQWGLKGRSRLPLSPTVRGIGVFEKPSSLAVRKTWGSDCL